MARVRGRGLDRREPLVQPGEAVADLDPELVERRVHPGRVEEQGEARRVPVEVRPEQLAHLADRAVPLGLVEQVRHEGLQPAAVSEERLERARQPAVVIGEVLAEDLVERGRRLVVGQGGPGQEAVELAPDRVHVDRDAGVLERDQPDPQGALDEGRPIVGGALRDEPGQPRVDQHEPFDDDGLAVEPNRAVRARALVARLRHVRRRGFGDPIGGRERDDVRVLHARSVADASDSSRVTVDRRHGATRGACLAHPFRTAPLPTTRAGVLRHRHSSYGTP